MKILCDNCKREFEGDEELMESLGKVLCPDCTSDLDIEFPV